MPLRIVACVAAVPHPGKVKWDRFRQLLDTQDAEPVLNPVDRHALELAASLAKQTDSTFDAICAGIGASTALREAAVFGANRLIAIANDALETADESGVAAALAAAVRHAGGADVVFCGSSTASVGSGAVPGLLSSHLDAGLLADALATETGEGRTIATVLAPSGLWRTALRPPIVVTAAPFGIKVRVISPLLLMRAAKKAIEAVSLADIGCGSLPWSGAADGGYEATRTKKAMEVVEGADARERASNLVSALRERLAL